MPLEYHCATCNETFREETYEAVIKRAAAPQPRAPRGAGEPHPGARGPAPGQDEGGLKRGSGTSPTASIPKSGG